MNDDDYNLTKFHCLERSSRGTQNVSCVSSRCLASKLVSAQHVDDQPVLNTTTKQNFIFFFSFFAFFFISFNLPTLVK